MTGLGGWVSFSARLAASIRSVAAAAGSLRRFGMEPPRLRFRPPFYGCLLLLPLLLDGLVVFQTYAVDLEVKDDSNVSCLFAKWMVKFSITYEGTDESKTATFMLPENLSYIGTSCGNETSGPVLSIEFGDGNSWTIRFTKTKDTYQGVITFVYNTGDSTFFPDAKRKERITIVANFPANPIPLNTAFSCGTEDTVKSGDVTQTFQSVTLQAFLQDGRLSSQKTLCDNDMTATIPGASKSGNTGTAELNATETPSSPTIQPEEKPASGSYTVKTGPVTCILANMGLQLNVTQQIPTIINFNPNSTVASGNCGKTTAVLRLSDGNTKVDFLFAVKNSTSSEKFYLKGVDISMTESLNATFLASNHTLNNWETTMGNSYLCRKEESIFVSPGYKVNIFDLKIQPFEVEEGQFSAAGECSLDDDTVLIPIVVGAALAGLVVIIVTTYLIGRRKTYAGYQTL
ncbi:lysosome-associated membrane glycoprotein 2 isoform X1 [Pantherophis guttatus]|uniref:Lysosome-associated membrane glycoprotein 2 n=1 Tax=Pantherophis guttatus TaxID=94885 RepID=A0ABM3YNC9_PANGU|nr:lysosome-associated membrane glycoprotein 2 isoform X1 [Pantherophis guttatus]